MQALSLHDKPGAERRPDPVPVLVAVRVCWFKVKAAVTDLLEFMVTVQVLLLVESQPDQPEKVEPVSGEATSVIVVPMSKLSEQSGSHLMPAPVILPEPLPNFSTSRVCWFNKVKVAVTDLLEVIVTVQAMPLLVSQPTQPEKVEPVFAEADSVTGVP